MLEIYINIENADILSLMKKELYEASLLIIEVKLAEPGIILGKEANLQMLKAICNSKLQRYPLAMQSLNKILKHKYTCQVEQNLLSQAFYLKAVCLMDHSKGKNKEKNRITFLAISDCLNLLNYRSEILELLDQFMNLVGERRNFYRNTQGNIYS